MRNNTPQNSDCVISFDCYKYASRIEDTEFPQLFENLRSYPTSHPNYQAARNRLIEGHLYYAAYIAKKFFSVEKNYSNNRLTAEDLEDLTSAATSALINAVDTFDYRKETFESGNWVKEFNAYKKVSVKNALEAYIKETNRNFYMVSYYPKFLHLDIHGKCRIKKRRKNKKKSAKLLRLEKLREDIANGKIKGKDTRRKKAEAILGKEHKNYYLSLYDSVKKDADDSDTIIMDYITDNRRAISEAKICLKNACEDVLTPKQKLVIELCFFQGKQQTQIAQMYGCSKANISKIKSSALKALSKSQYASSLRECLPTLCQPAFVMYKYN